VDPADCTRTVTDVPAKSEDETLQVGGYVDVHIIFNQIRDI
jgi:hypothetical protein